MTTRAERRLARTGDSLPGWHRKLEQRFGVIFGSYKVPRALRAGPLGLVYVGPMGPNSHPGSTYHDAWRDARGLEVTVLGRSFYFERDVV